MADIGTLRAIITADATSFNAAVAGAARKVETFSTLAGQKLKAVGESFQSVGRSMTMALTVPITALGGATLLAAGNFEKAMNRVQAVTGATTEDMAMMSNQAKDLGATTQFSASQAAEAMGFLGLAGFNTEQIIGALPKTLQLAASAQIELGEASEITANILAGYQLRVEDLAMANDVLVKAFTSSKTDLTALGQAFKFAGPVAKAAGFEFTETAAALGVMANAGFEATLGGTALRGSIARLLNPTKEAQKALNEMQITIADSDGTVRPFVQILQQFELAQKALGNEAQFTGKIMEIFGQRAGPGMLALLSQGSAAVSTLQSKLESAGGTAQRIADVQMKGFRGQMIALKSAVEGLFITLGDTGLLGMMTRAAKSMTEFVRELNKANPETMRFAIVVAAAVAAAGPLLFIFGKLTSLTGSLLTVLGAVSGVFATILPIVVGLIGPMVAVAGAIALVWGAFGDLINVQAALGTVWETVVGGFRSVANFFGEFSKFLKDENAAISESTKMAVEFIGKAWLSLRIAWNAVLVGLKTVAQGLIKIMVATLEPFKKAADFFGLDIGKSIGKAQKAMEGWIVTLEKAKTGNFETIKEMQDQWGKAPDQLREDVNALVATFDGIPEGIMANLESSFPGVMETIRGLVSGIQEFIDTGELPAAINVPVELPGIEGAKDQIKEFGKFTVDTGEKIAKMWRSVGQTYVQVFSQLSALYKKGSAEQKAFAIASIVLDTAIGIMKAFELPYPLNWAQAAAVAIMGATQLSQVGGGGSTGSAPGTGDTAIQEAVVAPQARESQIISADDDELTAGEGGEGEEKTMVIMLDPNTGNTITGMVVTATRDGIGDGSSNVLALQGNE